MFGSAFGTATTLPRTAMRCPAVWNKSAWNKYGPSAPCYGDLGHVLRHARTEFRPPGTLAATHAVRNDVHNTVCYKRPVRCFAVRKAMPAIPGREWRKEQDFRRLLARCQSPVADPGRPNGAICHPRRRRGFVEAAVQGSRVNNNGRRPGVRASAAGLPARGKKRHHIRQLAGFSTKVGYFHGILPDIGQWVEMVRRTFGATHKSTIVPTRRDCQSSL